MDAPAHLLDRQRYLDVLRAEGGRMATLIRDADPAAPVPSCDGWDVAALVDHIGNVHRFVTGSVAAGQPIDRKEIQKPGDDLATWFVEGFDEVVEMVDSRPFDDPCWTFVGPGQMWFHLRRQAHEHVIHRWDLEDALGIAASTPTDVAIDGIDEFLTGFHTPYRLAKQLVGEGETLHFHVTDGDGEWVLTRTGDGPVVERIHAKGDVAARGTAHDLLLFLWGRGSAEPLQVFGDEGLITWWAEHISP